MLNNVNVILIGGSSGTGKSILSRQLAKHFEMPICEVDDIRIIMQQIADKEKYVKLFHFLNNPNYINNLTINKFVDHQIEVCTEVWKGLKVLIEKHDYL